jgi:DNA-binding MarR family transcriptional regulator
MTEQVSGLQEPTDLELASRLRLALGRLYRRLRQHGPQALTASQESTLASLESLGPVRLGDLAAHEGVTAPTQSRLVTSLEEQGLLRRAPDPEDKRAARLAITAEGRRRLERLRNERSAFMVDQLATLSDRQRAAIVDALPALEILAGGDGGQ